MLNKNSFIPTGTHMVQHILITVFSYHLFTITITATDTWFYHLYLYPAAGIVLTSQSDNIMSDKHIIGFFYYKMHCILLNYSL